jgi:hypothetical protein
MWANVVPTELNEGAGSRLIGELRSRVEKDQDALD